MSLPLPTKLGGKDIGQGRLIYVPAIVSTVDFLFLFMSCALFFDRESVSAENLLPGNSGNQVKTMTSFTLSTHHYPTECVCVCVKLVWLTQTNSNRLSPDTKHRTQHSANT